MKWHKIDMIVNDILTGAAGGALLFGHIGSLYVGSGMIGFIIGSLLGVIIVVLSNVKRYGNC